MDYMDRSWFEDRMKALTEAGHTEAEAFDLLERGNPAKAASYLEHKVQELLGQLLQSDQQADS